MKKMILLIFSLLMIGCGSPNHIISISNNLPEDIFYNYTASSDTTYKWVDGKKITRIMGTLKPQESKDLNNIWYKKGSVNPWEINFRLTIKDELFSVYSNFLFFDMNFDVTDSLLKEPHNSIIQSVFRFERADSKLDNATNFYGITQDKDIYVLLDGVVYLADVSERKLVKVE